METATWDQSNPEDIICVVGARDKSQTIHGRNVAETQGRIPKVMVSEFGMSQPEADEFAAMAAEQRGKPSELDSAKATIRSLDRRSQNLEELLATAEKERDDARAERDKAAGDLSVAKAALSRAQAQIVAMQPKPAPTPPPSQGEKDKPAETSDDGKADKGP